MRTFRPGNIPNMLRGVCLCPGITLSPPQPLCRTPEIEAQEEVETRSSGLNLTFVAIPTLSVLNRALLSTLRMLDTVRSFSSGGRKALCRGALEGH